METFSSQSESIKEQNERIREEIQQLQSAREGLRSAATFTYKPTTEPPRVDWGPITDPTELALAKILSPPDLKELLPDPIPFAEDGGRDPGPEDLDDGKCWCYEAAQIDICPDCYTTHGTGEGAWTFRQPVADSADRWLPAHVRYLPARVEL